MAEDSSRGRNRRRYFRRKGGEKGQGASPQQEIERATVPPVSVPDEGPAMERRARVSRRKRRGRNRKSGDVRLETATVSSERDVEYRPPDSVLIYTHVVRPSSGVYEFRGEHFSSVGRTLDDYQIDIDSLFAQPDREARRRAVRDALAEWDFGEDESLPATGATPAMVDAPAIADTPVMADTPAAEALSAMEGGDAQAALSDSSATGAPLADDTPADDTPA